MKKVSFENNTYGISYIYDEGNSVIKDSLYNGTVLLPLGEALFSIIEGINIINQIALKDNKNLKENIDRYLSERNCNLNLLQRYEVDIIEVKRLIRIKDFLKLCTENPKYCCVESVESLALGILNPSSEIMSLFSPVGYLRIRKCKSPIKLPFAYSTDGLISQLKENYSGFAFSTETEFQCLSELCIISLFEIFSLGLQIKCCNICNRFYVGNSYDKYCSREMLQNDFKGCKNYKISLTSFKCSDNELMKEYKRICARLHARAKSNSKNAVADYEDFKSGWKKINIELKDKPNRLSELEAFLSLERWK